MAQNSFDNTSMQPVEEDSSGRNLVWFLLGVAGLGCGLLFALALLFFRPDAQALIDQYFPSPTSTTTGTPTPTRTPNLIATQRVIQSTETAQAIQTTDADASGNWDILLLDDFDSDNKKWNTG